MTAKNITFILELTKKCNNNCKYCYNVWKNDLNYPAKELNLIEWKNLIKIITNQVKPASWGVSGGEPLLHPNAIEIIKLLKKTKRPITLITNGTQLTEKNVRQLLWNKVKNIELPLVGANAETHDSLTRNIGSWEKVIRSMKLVKKYYGRLTTVFVITKQNCKQIKEMAEIAIAMGSDVILANYFNAGGEGIKYRDELSINSQELKLVLDELDYYAKEYEIPISFGVPVPPCVLDITKYKNIIFGYCPIGKENPYYAVDPAGNLRMCNHSRIILGNLFEESLEQIFNKDIYKNYINSIPKECSRCIKLEKCNASCRASGEVCFGTTEQLAPFVKNNFQIGC